MRANGRNFGTRPETLRKAVAARTPCGICHRPVRPSSLAAHENRHRLELQTKVCEWCGVEIRRNTRNGTVAWAARRFCSPACNARFQGNLNRTPLSESYRITPSGCWEWTRAVSPDGYGRARRRDVRSTTGAHRVVWTEMRGPLPEGLQLDHLCRNPRCVNPDHLEPVTGAENTRRAKSLQTHCRNGHPLDGRRDGGTHRYCLTCHREREAKRREARRVLAA